MDFGMPTLIEIDDLQATAKLCRELSLSFIELNMNLPQYQTTKLEADTEYLKLFGSQYGLYYTIHLDENLNVCDFNDEVRNAYILTVLKTIELAKQLGVPVLNMHMNHGVHFTLPDKKVDLFAQYKDDYLQSISDFKNQCEEAIGNANIKICVENTNGFRTYEQEAIDLLLTSSAFGLTWDIGHSNAAGNTDEAYIMRHENRLCHFHIHDSLEKADHMTLGTGEIDLKQRLWIADKHHCRCVVETKTMDALRLSVAWLNHNGYLSTNMK